MAAGSGLNAAPSGAPAAAAAITKSPASPSPSGPSTRSLVFAAIVLSSFSLFLFLVTTILYACSKRRQRKERQSPSRDPEATPAIALTSEAVNLQTAAKAPGPLTSNPIVSESSANSLLYWRNMTGEATRRKTSSDCTSSCASSPPIHRSPAPPKRVFKVYEASRKQPKRKPHPNFSAPLPGINITMPSTNPTPTASPANPVRRNGIYPPQLPSRLPLKPVHFRPISSIGQVSPISPIFPIPARVSTRSPLPEPLRPTSTYGRNIILKQQQHTKLNGQDSVRFTLELAGEDVRYAMLGDEIPEDDFEEIDIYHGEDALGRVPIDSAAGSPV